MLPPSGGSCVVALSGGSDSVGLLHLLCILAARGELTVAGAAHLNHGLRDAADEDERFCRERAAELGIPVCVERADVRARSPGLAHLDSKTPDVVRATRSSSAAAAELSASAIATGHTLDDQAETFLLQLIRGPVRAGCRGSARTSVSFGGLSSTFVGKRSGSGSPPRDSLP